MAESVPDPFSMEPDLLDEQMNEEPEENMEYLEVNANPGYDSNERESTPVPEEAVPRQPDVCVYKENKPDKEYIVETAAVDLEALTVNYTGPALFERLQYIIDHCPPLEKDGIICLINALRKDSSNTIRYAQLFPQLAALDATHTNFDIPVLDAIWVEQTQAACGSRLDHLLTEYKKQKDEGVKESTRRAMFELFQHYKVTGCYADCLRLYARGMREYCSQFKHMIQMYLQWLEVIIFSNEWARVDPLISNAERCIHDADDAESRDKTNRTSSLQGFKSNRQLITSGRAKIDAISGLSKIVAGKYKQAAEKFIKVDVDLLELPWIIHSSEIAHYTALTALASLERIEIKKKVLSDATCRKFLESEPQIVELLQNFVGSRFGLVFDTLAALTDKLRLDPYIADHVERMIAIIRERALVQYLIPFSCASIKEVAFAFRTTEDEIESEIVRLIDSDQLKAKIDSIGGIVRMHQADPRQDTYRKIIENCEIMIERAQVTLFRSLIAQTKLNPSEPRNKRKGGFNNEEGSDILVASRGKINISGITKAFKAGSSKVFSDILPFLQDSSLQLPPSEADSSEGSNEDARDSEN
ncbi:unnamed protein product [Auanema sp. JU1783]|nr:unnamed protein product [Auanema sp. JU1783]